MFPTLIFAALLAIRVSAGSNKHLGKFARVVTPEVASNTTYNFIIAGGGIGGLTVADRLTEDPNVSVLVIEYGPIDKGEPYVLVPGEWVPIFYWWNGITSVPQVHLNNAVYPVLMGQCVGGGSTVNAMFLHRCPAVDYDSWAALGNPGWDWDSLLPYFKKSENFTAPDPAFAQQSNITYQNSVHGFKGPVHASYSPYTYPGSSHFWNAALAVGIPESIDPNNGNDTGLFTLLRALNPDTETRSYAKTAHYDRVSFRPNYHLLTNTAVSKVTFTGKTATGVQYIPVGTTQVFNVTALNEVILAAGAVHSPQILQLSGVGPKALLKSLGVPVVLDLPGVGTNFQDQLNMPVTYNFTSNVFPNADSLQNNATFFAEQLALYNSAHQGALTLTAQTGNNVVSLSLKETTTNWTALIALAASQNPASLLPPGSDPTVIAGYAAQRKQILDLYASYNSAIGSISWNTGATTSVYMVKPLSRGTIKINSTSIFDNPLVDFGALTDPTDIELVLALIRKNRQIMAQPTMQQLGPTELTPGAGLTTDDQIKTAIRAQINPSIAHECCTLPMLPLEHGGVVDPNRLVYGLKGLRVVDVSAWPFTPGSAPSATLYAAGEKLADIIKLANGIPVIPLSSYA